MLKVKSLYRYKNLKQESRDMCFATRTIIDMVHFEQDRITINKVINDKNNLFLISNILYTDVVKRNKSITYCVYECFVISTMEYFYIPIPKNDYLMSLNLNLFEKEFEEVI